MILAIVGTRRFSNLRARGYAEMLITYEMRNSEWDSFVTGDAGGVDTWVKEICDYSGRSCLVLSPRNKQWEPDGYKARNILIAEACDELLCIRDPESVTYGSGWTADYADTLGKPVTRITIS